MSTRSYFSPLVLISVLLLPTAAGQQPAPFSGGSCSSGANSFAGEYCPSGPDNRGVQFNICPRGHYCPDATTHVRCPPGKFCPSGTWNGGISCPALLMPFDHLDWGYAAWCPHQVEEPLVCPAGHYCPNTTIALPCPPGQWCAVGQSRGTPCEPDLFGALSAADRCPGQGHHPDGGGSRSPPSQKSWLLWLLIGAVPFVIVVELASVWERRRRGRKRAEGLDLMPDIDASDAQYSGMDAQQPNDMDDTAWRLAWLSRAGGAGLRSSEGEPSPVRRSDSSLASSTNCHCHEESAVPRG